MNQYKIHKRVKFLRMLVGNNEYPFDLKNKRQTPTLIGVTPQHHNTYTPLMAHAWGRCWGIRGSLGEACKCLCTGRYKDT